MSRDTALTLFAIIGIIVLLGLAVGGYVWWEFNTQADVTDTVVKSERVVNQDGSGSKYLIFGKHETYEDTDDMLFGKFNSSDVYGAIQNGHTYQFHVNGVRMPFLSSYRNILSATEVSPQK